MRCVLLCTHSQILNICHVFNSHIIHIVVQFLKASSYLEAPFCGVHLRCSFEGISSTQKQAGKGRDVAQGHPHG